MDYKRMHYDTVRKFEKDLIDTLSRGTMQNITNWIEVKITRCSDSLSQESFDFFEALRNVLIGLISEKNLSAIRSLWEAVDSDFHERENACPVKVPQYRSHLCFSLALVIIRSEKDLRRETNVCDLLRKYICSLLEKLQSIDNPEWRMSLRRNCQGALSILGLRGHENFYEVLDDLAGPLAGPPRDEPQDPGKCRRCSKPLVYRGTLSSLTVGAPVASFAPGSSGASFAPVASFAPGASFAAGASAAPVASFALGASVASFAPGAPVAPVASFAPSAPVASFATGASFAPVASFAPDPSIAPVDSSAPGASVAPASVPITLNQEAAMQEYFPGIPSVPGPSNLHYWQLGYALPPSQPAGGLGRVEPQNRQASVQDQGQDTDSSDLIDIEY